MADLAGYYSRYDLEHRHPANKLLHGIGIPVIVVGVAVAALTMWRLALALFIGGWLLLFLGHRLEGNRPAFFQGAMYLMVGPLWVARELKQWLASPLARRTGPGRAPLPPFPFSTSGATRMGRGFKHWLLSSPPRRSRR